MAMEVYATVDGIMKHRHAGANGWHSAHIKHADSSLHETEKAEEPSFRDGLMDELKTRYFEALAGKSFEYLWAPGKDSRGSWRTKPVGSLEADVAAALENFEASLKPTEEPKYQELVFKAKDWRALDRAITKLAA